MIGHRAFRAYEDGGGGAYVQCRNCGSDATHFDPGDGWSCSACGASDSDKRVPNEAPARPAAEVREEDDRNWEQVRGENERLRKVAWEYVAETDAIQPWEWAERFLDALEAREARELPDGSLLAEVRDLTRRLAQADRNWEQARDENDQLRQVLRVLLDPAASGGQVGEAEVRGHALLGREGGHD